ncbi:hypothetical protein NMW26_03940, partial [Escherichia coli]|uniref:hypothetical protein n=1 Tax=Escherichia coli TaxID=562 RepID=UPI002245ABA9
MGSKSFLLVGLLLAVFLTICSEVLARELAETSPAVKLDNENEADVDGYHGGGYHKGGGYKKCRYRCKGHCCSYEEYVAMGKVTEASPAVKLDNENEVDVDGYHGGGYHKGGGYKKCRYRCKGHCCSYEEYVA